MKKEGDGETEETGNNLEVGNKKRLNILCIMNTKENLNDVIQSMKFTVIMPKFKFFDTL